MQLYSLIDFFVDLNIGIYNLSTAINELSLVHANEDCCI